MASNFIVSQQSAKLSELRDHLLTSGSAEARAVNGSSAAPQNEMMEIADSLFHRAPEEFVERTSIKNMAAITEQSADVFKSFLNADNPYLINITNPTEEGRQKYTAITTVVSDRPFIVDTIQEFLRLRNLHTFVLLHPIIRRDDGRRASLGYIETDRLSPELIEALQEELGSVLNELLSATEDFTAMLVRVETAARVIEGGSNVDEYSESERRELGDFLRWLADGGFVFLGYKEWVLDRKTSSLKEVPDASLGFYRTENPEFAQMLQEAERDAAFLSGKDDLLYFSKVLSESPIHRHVRMDLVTLKITSPDGQTTKFQSFLGLLSSRSMGQESSAIPIIRRKLQKIIELEGLIPNSHDYKEVVSIVDGMPKSELFQQDIDSIRQALNLVMSIQDRSETRVSVHSDALSRFVSIMVVLPRERFTGGVRHRIQEYLETTFESGTNSAEYRLAVAEASLIRIYFLVPNPTYRPVEADIDEIELHIIRLTFTWDDNLLDTLEEHYPRAEARRLYAFYRSTFPETYKSINSPHDALLDIEMLEQVNPSNPLELSIRPTELSHEDTGILLEAPHDAATNGVIASNQFYGLRLYKREGGLTLSAILPYLENAGFSIVDETLTNLSVNDSVWAAIYYLRIRPKLDVPFHQETIDSIVIPGLKQVLNHDAEDDALNTLLVQPGLNCSEIAILRALRNYLWQIQAFASRQYIDRAMTKNPTQTKLLVDYFRLKFDPEQFPNDPSAREVALVALKEDFTTALKDVHQLVFDQALRALLNVIDSTVRTNYFQIPDQLRIAIKIDCQNIAEMPWPRPMYEVFVSAPDFEGVHLRSGKVARGGLRWSDRPDDFRTEVLGLMRTQTLKNSIIVPAGAKGGFILKSKPPQSSQLYDTVREVYGRFITSLLEITDNRVESEVVPPQKCVIYDEPDPYLVVAADKGTATFSDEANRIATEKFDFWLQDAFASGGSYGYDHKKLGITARGTWEAVRRHFREIGINVDEQSYTVVGVGDMSGDVFGNGLLLQEKAHLLAAFDHRHIFIDPNPDVERSYAERQRMFELPRSDWTDYDESLISKGGGVYPRSQKEIPLSEETKAALGVHEDVLSGQELIQAVLKAPADLLWNGGIGTYVKASFETNLVVGDPSNDDVRVDARDLRVKIIGEGGNLGVTQLGRIEYSKVGGHINVDAVDNSGGVDISDLEVNLKILFADPLRRGALALEERNELLFSVAEEVREKVVARNRSQSLVLSLGVHRSRKNVDYYSGMMHKLEQEGLLNREAEYLPDDETLNKRSQLKAGLTRPELAFLISYAKISLFNTIIGSSLPEEPFLHRYLKSYFPKKIVDRFPADTIAHPLRREIIATQVANTIAERMGASFVYRLSEETGAPRTDIISAFLAADAIVGGRSLVERLAIVDTASTTRVHLKALVRITAAIDSMTRWILENRSNNLTWTNIVDRYRDPARLLIEETGAVLVQIDLNRYQDANKQLISSGVPEDLARTIASVTYGAAFLDIVEISTTLGVEVLDVASLFAQLSSELQVTRLLDQASDIEPVDRWEALSIRTVMAEIRDCIGLMTRAVIEETGSASSDAMSHFLTQRHEIIERYRQSAQAFQNRPFTIPALLVISNQLRAVSRTVD